MESLGWIVEKAGPANVFVRKLPILSFLSVIKVQRYQAIDWQALDKIVNKYHAILVRLEPRTLAPKGASSAYNLEPRGFRRDNWPLLPTKTLVIDLGSISLDSLPKDTRYEIRKAEKRTVLIKNCSLQEESLEIFIEFWHKNAWRKGFWVPLKKEIKNLATAFGKDTTFFMAYPKNSLTPLAGALVCRYQNTANYLYAFSTPEGRKISAAYLVLWKIIDFLKKKKVKHLDLEGVYDERYPKQTKNWQGFTKFKMRWGGKVKEYPGSYTKYF